jgi:hypothetical protein
LHQISSTHGTTTEEAVPREIVRTLRRICLWHELERDVGDVAAEQRRLEEQVAAYRAIGGAQALPTERMDALRRLEEDRAATAAALGEMLGPLLTERLAAAAAGPGAGHRARPGLEPALSRRERPASPLPIADLIDGMLAQEERPTA